MKGSIKVGTKRGSKPSYRHSIGWIEENPMLMQNDPTGIYTVLKVYRNGTPGGIDGRGYTFT